MTLNSSQGDCDYNTCTRVLKRNSILSSSNQTGIHLYNNSSPRKLFRVTISLVEINLTKPKNNLPPTECKALKALNDEQINLRKTIKGTNTVVMTKEDKFNLM